MSKIVLKNGGTIDKYMGDCIMAFWNATLDYVNRAKWQLKHLLNVLKKQTK